TSPLPNKNGFEAIYCCDYHFSDAASCKLGGPIKKAAHPQKRRLKMQYLNRYTYYATGIAKHEIAEENNIFILLRV
ncbi:MAG: hypothetical protein KDE50_37720, partial [Caldilineaceae bacterium]|nr:hypothetical protein [Caldilineaceae bacterium]